MPATPRRSATRLAALLGVAALVGVLLIGFVARAWLWPALVVILLCLLGMLILRSADEL